MLTHVVGYQIRNLNDQIERFCDKLEIYLIKQNLDTLKTDRLTVYRVPNRPNIKLTQILSESELTTLFNQHAILKKYFQITERKGYVGFRLKKISTSINK